MFLNRPEVLTLDKALARRYQHKSSRHKRILENRLQRRKEVVKGKGLSVDLAPDEELSDGGYSSICNQPKAMSIVGYLTHCLGW